MSKFAVKSKVFPTGEIEIKDKIFVVNDTVKKSIVKTKKYSIHVDIFNSREQAQSAINNELQRQARKERLIPKKKYYTARISFEAYRKLQKEAELHNDSICDIASKAVIFGFKRALQNVVKNKNDKLNYKEEEKEKLHPNPLQFKSYQPITGEEFRYFLDCYLEHSALNPPKPTKPLEIPSCDQKYYQGAI
ncbi:hypothetical protein AAEX28_12420 [Lentisphaerota bacterium WC36G]|nr:hypothetical protein LJT99_15245 [Lentisphaerae bacterium WC36]